MKSDVRKKCEYLQNRKKKSINLFKIRISVNMRGVV